MENSVVLIGLDGATFSILDAMMEEGVMPFLKKFTASGVRGELLSVIPPVTAPAWVSLMTGRSPGNHGITNFMQFESPHSRYLKFVSFRDNCCETIWSIISRHSMRVGCLNFIAMNPPPPISGYVIPGWVTWRWMRKNSYPADLFERMKNLDGLNMEELGLDFDAEEKAVEGCPKEEYEPWIQLQTRREIGWFRILRHLVQEEPCHLTAIVFDGIDRIQHLCWRFIDHAYWPKAPSAWERKIRALCFSFFKRIDEIIAGIVNIAKDASVFIVSDHGGGPSTEILYINALLAKLGYLKWSDKSKRESESSRSMTMGVNSHIRSFDWASTTAYASTVASNGIFISVAGERGEEGIKKGDYFDFRRKLIESLQKHCVDPSTGEPVISNIRTREEAFAGSQMNRAPDLTLALRDGGQISVRPSGVFLEPREEVIGVHRPDGIFIAAGPAFPGGMQIPQISILDVAPTILYTLGLPIPEDLEGRVLNEIFEPSFVNANPVRFGEPTLKPHDLKLIKEAESEEDSQKIMKRLKALGYIE